MAKKIKVPKEDQTYIEGTAPARINEIEKAAIQYVNYRDSRMEAGEEEVRLKVKLISIMKQHGITEYNFRGYMVQLNHVDEDTVKVKKLKAAE